MLSELLEGKSNVLGGVEISRDVKLDMISDPDLTQGILSNLKVHSEKDGIKYGEEDVISIFVLSPEKPILRIHTDVKSKETKISYMAKTN